MKDDLITNLDKSAFAVYENNQRKRFTSFRHEDRSWRWASSSTFRSMREKREQVNKAALISCAPAILKTSVYRHFNDEFYLDQDYTQHQETRRRAGKSGIAWAARRCTMRLVASSEYLKQSKLQKRFCCRTDGEDNAAGHARRASNGCQVKSPTVYAIGLLGEEKQRRAAGRSDNCRAHSGIAFLPVTW